MNRFGALLSDESGSGSESESESVGTPAAYHAFFNNPTLLKMFLSPLARYRVLKFY